MSSIDPYYSLQEASVLKEIVQSLLHLIDEPVLLSDNDLRAHPRYEVNWSAMLRYEDDPVWMPIFIRDISEKGVGFRHGVPLPEGVATISFFTSADRPSVQLRVRLLWCQKTDGEMYLSGSEFLGVAHDVASPW
jgi:hypothetical protein